MFRCGTVVSHPDWVGKSDLEVVNCAIAELTNGVRTDSPCSPRAISVPGYGWVCQPYPSCRAQVLVREKVASSPNQVLSVARQIVDSDMTSPFAAYIPPN
jgi:hypothetical protein